jgi:pimeloyl-ACP methyl ester carboxylesterase
VSFAPVRETVRMMFPMIAGFSPDEYALTDAMNRMNQKAVLFIQGEYDEVFGSDGAKHLQSLAKNDNESSLWIVPEATHLRCRTYDIEQYLSKVDSFLDEIYDSSHAA